MARYGALVRARLGGWFEGAGAGEYARVIDVYYGPQSAHDLLERTVWHAAQHLRQLYVLAGELGVGPRAAAHDRPRGSPAAHEPLVAPSPHPATIIHRRAHRVRRGAGPWSRTGRKP